MVALLVFFVVMAFYIGYETKPSAELKIFREGTFSDSTNLLGKVSLKLPAVDKNGKGVLGNLEVELTKGNGGFYVKIDKENPIINPDTQTSFRTAVETAKKITGQSLSDKNIYYSITADSEMVGGRSAGAAITVATIALLDGEKLKEQMIVTGTVEEDGSIGAVGNVLEKAEVSKENGFTTILVPEGEAVQRVPVEKCSEQRMGNAIIRQCSTTFKEVDIEKETGIKVIEVRNVKDAYELMKAPSGR